MSKVHMTRRAALAVAGHLAMAGALAVAWTGYYPRGGLTLRDPLAIAAPADAAAAGSIRVQVRPPHDLEGLDSTRELSVTMRRGSTAGALQAQLGQMFPELVPMMPYLFIAVGGEMQSSTLVLMDGDSIELVAPVAGG